MSDICKSVKAHGRGFSRHRMKWPVSWNGEEVFFILVTSEADLGHSKG